MFSCLLTLVEEHNLTMFFDHLMNQMITLATSVCHLFYCLVVPFTDFFFVFFVFFLEWSSAPKTFDHLQEPTHNGRSEQQQPEEIQVLPVVSSAAQVGIK